MSTSEYIGPKLNFYHSSHITDSVAASGTAREGEGEGDDGEDLLPPPLKGLPDNLRRLLLGRTGHARTAVRTNKIAIYVCAADSQGEAEHRPLCYLRHET